MLQLVGAVTGMVIVNTAVLYVFVTILIKVAE